MTPIFCPHCGKQLLLSGQKFCAYCAGDLSPLAEGERTGSTTPSASTSTPTVASPLPDVPGITRAAVSSAPPVLTTSDAAIDRLARESAARRQTPLPPSQIEDRPTEIVVAAACAGIALLSTVLPWAQTVLGISVSALQGEPILLVPPAGALVAYWQLQSGPPQSLTSGAVYGLRLAYGIGLVLCLIILGEMNNANSTLGIFGASGAISLGIGFWAYAAASAVGLVASFLTDIYHDDQAPYPASRASSPSGRLTPSAGRPDVACPICGKPNASGRTVCRWCSGPLTKVGQTGEIAWRDESEPVGEP